jgi:hypothetical protein
VPGASETGSHITVDKVDLDDPYGGESKKLPPLLPLLHTLKRRSAIIGD